MRVHTELLKYNQSNTPGDTPDKGVNLKDDINLTSSSAQDAKIKGSNKKNDDPYKFWKLAQEVGKNIKTKDDEAMREHLDKIQNCFVTKVSNSSCKIEDITGIIYGGISSRFWLYRKHIICQDFEEDMASKDNGKKKKSSKISK